MSASDDAAVPKLSLAQQREALWADGRVRAYAVLIGSKVPGLRDRLAKADIDDWDGLWTGELDSAEKTAAPILVSLRRESTFTQWLLGSAAADFPNWGAIALSRQSFLAMRAQGRALCKAQLPNGQAIRIDWMDPEVMEALLPAAAPDQIERLFASLETLVTLSPTQWVRWSVSMGKLRRERSGVLA